MAIQIVQEPFLRGGVIIFYPDSFAVRINEKRAVLEGRRANSIRGPGSPRKTHS